MENTAWVRIVRGSVASRSEIYIGKETAAAIATVGSPRQVQPPRGVREVEKKPEGAEHVPLHPDETMSRARVRVEQLETAMKAVDADDPALPELQEVLKKVQSQAKVPSIESRLKVAEEYLARKEEAPTGRGTDFGSGSRRPRSFPSRSDSGGEESDQVA